MLFGLKKPKIKSRVHAVGDIAFFLIFLLMIISGIIILHGGNLSDEQTSQWIEDILFAAILVFPYGLYKAYWAFIAIIKNDYSNESDIVICLNCHEMFSANAVNKMICPKCTGTLENLAGFYERQSRSDG